MIRWREIEKVQTVHLTVRVCTLSHKPMLQPLWSSPLTLWRLFVVLARLKWDWVNTVISMSTNKLHFHSEQCIWSQWCGTLEAAEFRAVIPDVHYSCRNTISQPLNMLSSSRDNYSRMADRRALKPWETSLLITLLIHITLILYCYL